MNAGKRTDPEKTLIWLNQMLKDANVTVPQLANWLGISENQVYGWRGGKIGVKKIHLMAMAYIFDHILHKDFGDYVYIDHRNGYQMIEELFESLCFHPEEASKGA